VCGIFVIIRASQLVWTKFATIRIKIQKQVLNKVQQIPKRKITTYQLLARAISRAKAARAVDNVLNSNLYLIKILCHRVIKSDGNTGNYNLGIEKRKNYSKKKDRQ